MGKRTNLVFTAPYEMALETEMLPAPAPDQVLVETLASAISAGTELLFYRGQVPDEMSVDATLAALAGAVRYPLRYGYALVGIVVETGAAVDPAWQGRRVFVFHPHCSHLLATPAELIPVPETVTTEQALFLPNMESAVNFVQDGAPVIGERVVVLGQGVVGLLTTTLLARFPLEQLVAIDQFPRRREASRRLGATAVYGDMSGAAQREVDADLVYELTGNPAALNTAIALAGYDGRVVIGSWYGRKRAEIDLGGHFHRSRIRLISSQVSTIAPHRQGRWNKARRFDVAWRMLAAFDPAALVTHRFAIQDAAQAYSLLDQQPDEALQVLLTYGLAP
ncbi:MAG: zinc-binding alcohol dehydrogenase [Caldilineaceae bacterium]|nr:zinc-binding alcohol dehydrogenase [Caldilineaceae bacterium]